VKVLDAGASGAIGRVLVPQLLLAGHEIVGLTPREDRAAALRRTGAAAIICDALDARAVRAVTEAIVDELTSLPTAYASRTRAGPVYVDSGNRAVSAVPLPSARSICSRPPSASTRSATPRSPWLSGSAPPSGVGLVRAAGRALVASVRRSRCARSWPRYGAGVGR
jgi:hypothetical protein